MLQAAISFIIISILASSSTAICFLKLGPYGALSNVDSNDPGVIEAAKYSAFVHPFDNSENNYFLISAQKKIVGETKYFLTLQFRSGVCDYQILCPIINQYSLDSVKCSNNEINFFHTRLGNIPMTSTQKFFRF